jgi:hypothetical protein
MDNTFQEFLSRNNTFKVAHAGYTYSRRSGNNRCDKAGNKVDYFYCVDRAKCSASVIKRGDQWSKGKGKAWCDGKHASHEPDLDK